MGCNRSFSPVVDIDFIFQNPITITRTYGSDPERVARMSRAYMKGLEESGIVLIGATERAFSASALFGTIFALGADTIEYGEWKSGVRTEGLISAAVSASTKLGAGMGIVLIGWVLGMCGYVGGAAAPSASAIAAIKALFLYVPLGQFVLQIALLWFYRLDGEYPEIVRELRARSAPQAIN
jgi:GPH family glycoside/pentoside/hexuronide:cation symporter